MTSTTVDSVAGLCPAPCAHTQALDLTGFDKSLTAKNTPGPPSQRHRRRAAVLVHSGSLWDSVCLSWSSVIISFAEWLGVISRLLSRMQDRILWHNGLVLVSLLDRVNSVSFQVTNLQSFRVALFYLAGTLTCRSGLGFGLGFEGSTHYNQGLFSQKTPCCNWSGHSKHLLLLSHTGSLASFPTCPVLVSALEPPPALWLASHAPAAQATGPHPYFLKSHDNNQILLVCFTCLPI